MCAATLAVQAAQRRRRAPWCISSCKRSQDTLLSPPTCFPSLSPFSSLPSPQLPFYALIVFGCYALVSVGSALFNYRDCDEAFDSLQEVRQKPKRVSATVTSAAATVRCPCLSRLITSLSLLSASPSPQDIKDARRRLAAKGYKTPAGL